MGKVSQAANTGMPDDLEFFQSVAELIQSARHEVEKRVNTAMVVTYFEIGRRIVEKEQQGAKRAQYGKKVIQGLSDYLTAHLGKGYSVENLKLMRRFYVVYSAPIGQSAIHQFDAKPIGQSVITQFNPKPIGQTVFTQFDAKPISETVFHQFNPNITWTHYILLTRIDNPDERRFYEIEIAGNGWSFRIVLCRDKKDAMVEMMLPAENKRVFAAKYKTVLPSKSDLKRLLEGTNAV